MPYKTTQSPPISDQGDGLEGGEALLQKAEIARRLRDWRRKVIQKTQGELADLIGLNIGLIKKYENPAIQTMPGASSLIALSKTGLNIHWLLTGNGRITISEKFDQPSQDEVELTSQLKMREVQGLLDRFEAHERASLVSSILKLIEDAAKVAEIESHLAQKRFLLDEDEESIFLDKPKDDGIVES